VRVGAPVYCPTWMPNPLDGEIGGQWDNGVSVKKDKSYLVSFLWHEPPSQDVHVNFRGYPGRTKIPRCEDIEVVAGKVHKTYSPCFSDPNGKRRFGPITATLYTVNRGVDQWHILYAWKDHGSLYAVSEHVAKPLTFQQVHRNLDRVMRGLVTVSPSRHEAHAEGAARRRRGRGGSRRGGHLRARRQAGRLTDPLRRGP